MPAERLKVRDAEEDVYEVLDDGEPISSFATIVEAARFVRDRGARLWLEWGRTVISGQARPFDFSPTFLGSDTVGRVIGEHHGPGAGSWSWLISTHDDRWRKHGGQRGNAPTKEPPLPTSSGTLYLADMPSRPSAYAKAKGVRLTKLSAPHTGKRWDACLLRLGPREHSGMFCFRRDGVWEHPSSSIGCAEKKQAIIIA